MSRLDVERLRAAGFEPDFNVCASCHHHGSRHDLNNKCLDCGDRFSSMSKQEQWDWGIAEYTRLGGAVTDDPGRIGSEPAISGGWPLPSKEAQR